MPAIRHFTDYIRYMLHFYCVLDVYFSEIIQFVKAEGLTVDPSLFESLIYAIASEGKYGEADAAVHVGLV